MPSLRAAALSGMFWMSASVVIVKIMTLLLQVVLGYLLEPGDYAIFAVVSVAMTFVGGFQNSGIAKLIIQQQIEDKAELSRYTTFSLYMGVLGLAVAVILGFVFAGFYAMPALVGVVALSAISVPFAALSGIQFAILSLRHQFRYMCGTDFYVALANFLCVVGAAYLGAKYYSLAFGLVVSALLRYTLYYHAVKGGVSSLVLPGTIVKEIWGQVRWLVVMAFLSGLAQQGDYFALARVVPKDTLGYYYFGFQITANIGQMLGQGIGSILLPVLSSIKDDAKRHYQAFLKTCTLTTFLCCIIALGTIGFSPWFIHIVWKGKWDAAIFTAIALAYTLPIRMLGTVGATTIDSSGRWKLQVRLLIFDAGTMIAAALVGGIYWGLYGASIAVALQRGVVGVVYFGAAMAKSQVKRSEIVGYIAKVFGPYGVIAACLGTVNEIYPALAQGAGSIVTYGVRTTIAVVVFVACASIVDRDIIVEIKKTLQNLRKRKAA